MPKSLRVDGGSIFIRVKADINAKELAWWPLASCMRSDRWQVLASDLKSVPPLALGRVKFRVNLIKCPIGVAFSSPPHLGLGQHFKVLWHLQNCLDGAKIVQRVRE